MCLCIAARFGASRRRKKELKPSRDKKARHEPYVVVVGRREIACYIRMPCDPGSEFRLLGRNERKNKGAEVVNEQKKNKMSSAVRTKRAVLQRSCVASPPKVGVTSPDWAIMLLLLQYTRHTRCLLHVMCRFDGFHLPLHTEHSCDKKR